MNISVKSVLPASANHRQKIRPQTLKLPSDRHEWSLMAFHSKLTENFKKYNFLTHFNVCNTFSLKIKNGLTPFLQLDLGSTFWISNFHPHLAENFDDPIF